MNEQVGYDLKIIAICKCLHLFLKWTTEWHLRRAFSSTTMLVQRRLEQEASKIKALNG